MDDTKLLTANIPAELADELDRFAEQSARPRDGIVSEALAEWLAWEEKKYQMTLEGLADVDAGRVIEDEAVRAWIESLDTDNPLPRPTAR